MPELKLTRDAVCVTETLLDTAAEQPVELDYSLPDYYPSIFRLLKTSIRPVIQQTRISGKSLTLDGVCRITVLYLGEEDNSLQAVEQTMPFSKTLELKGECDAPVIRCSCRCYHAGGRAVSPRRLDIRGGVSIRARVTGQRELPVVSAASGSGIQLHTTLLSLCGKRRSAQKPFTVSEDLELPQSKPPFGTLLASRDAVRMEDCKIIANKVICRGELCCHLLYLPDGGGQPETMEYTVPISQIADLPGVDEGDRIDARFEPAGLTLEAIPGGENGCRHLSAEWNLILNCVSDQNRDMAIADDAFSTRCPTELSRTPALAERMVGSVNLSQTVRGEMNTEPVSQVLDLLCNIGEISARAENGAVIVNGTLEVTALCLDRDGVPFTADKTLPFEFPADCSCNGELSFSPMVQILSAGYAITGEAAVEARIQLQVTGAVCEKLPISGITDIALDEEAAVPPPSSALRLYFGEPGEALWDIARRFGASMAAVMEENELDSETLPERQMLLIPMVED